jgi:hypothetical protein
MELPPKKLRYFIKEVLSTKVWSTKGYQIPFDDIGEDTGLLITDHVGLLEELDIAIARKRGGIREIDGSEVEEVKKKALTNQLHLNSLTSNRFDQLRLSSTKPFNPNPSPPGAPVVAGEPPKAIQPGAPLSDVPTIDPALLRPKPAKKKLRDATVEAAVPMVPVVPTDPPPP